MQYSRNRCIPNVSIYGACDYFPARSILYAVPHGLAGFLRISYSCLVTRVLDAVCEIWMRMVFGRNVHDEEQLKST